MVKWRNQFAKDDCIQEAKGKIIIKEQDKALTISHVIRMKKEGRKVVCKQRNGSIKD